MPDEVKEIEALAQHVARIHSDTGNCACVARHALLMLADLREIDRLIDLSQSESTDIASRHVKVSTIASKYRRV